MNCQSIPVSIAPILSQQKPGDSPQMDKSIAYEMINDFGVDAFLGVIQQYQQNMANNLKMLQDCTEKRSTGEQLWALQYIRNCSAQLGLSTVSLHCMKVMDGLHNSHASAVAIPSEIHSHIEAIIDNFSGITENHCLTNAIAEPFSPSHLNLKFATRSLTQTYAPRWFAFEFFKPARNLINP